MNDQTDIPDLSDAMKLRVKALAERAGGRLSVGYRTDDGRWACSLMVNGMLFFADGRTVEAAVDQVEREYDSSGVTLPYGPPRARWLHPASIMTRAFKHYCWYCVTRTHWTTDDEGVTRCEVCRTPLLRKKQV